MKSNFEKILNKISIIFMITIFLVVAFTLSGRGVWGQGQTNPCKYSFEDNKIVLSGDYSNNRCKVEDALNVIKDRISQISTNNDNSYYIYDEIELKKLADTIRYIENPFKDPPDEIKEVMGQTITEDQIEQELERERDNRIAEQEKREKQARIEAEARKKLIETFTKLIEESKENENAEENIFSRTDTVEQARIEASIINYSTYEQQQEQNRNYALYPSDYTEGPLAEQARNNNFIENSYKYVDSKSEEELNIVEQERIEAEAREKHIETLKKLIQESEENIFLSTDTVKQANIDYYYKNQLEYINSGSVNEIYNYGGELIEDQQLFDKSIELWRLMSENISKSTTYKIFQEEYWRINNLLRERGYDFTSNLQSSAIEVTQTLSQIPVVKNIVPPPPPRSVENTRVVKQVNKGDTTTSDIDRLVRESLKSNKTHNAIIDAAIDLSDGISDGEADKIQRMVSEGLLDVTLSADGIPIIKYNAQPQEKKCRRDLWRPCNDLPLDERGNIQRNMRKYINEDNCGSAWQISGCGIMRRCELEPCCTATAPLKATNLELKNLDNTSTNIISGLDIYNRKTFTYLNNSFGKGCPTNNNQNAIQVYNNFFKDQSTKTYLGGSKWIAQTNRYQTSLGSFLDGRYMCNSDIIWRVAKNNGSKKSYSGWSNIQLQDMEPKITSITSSVDEFDKKADVSSEITIYITAEGPYVKDITTTLEVYDLNNNLLSEPTEIDNYTCNSKRECVRELKFTTPPDTNRIYKFIASTQNACGEKSDDTAEITNEYIIEVKERFRVKVNSYLLSEVVNPDESPICTGNRVENTNGSITIHSQYSDFSQTKNLDGSNTITFEVLPREVFPLYLSAKGKLEECRETNLYCINEVSLEDADLITLPENKETEVDISFAETKSDSWVTMFNADIFADRIAINSGCDQDEVGGGFIPTTLSKTDNSIGGNIYAKDEIYSEDKFLINPSDTGTYLKNLEINGEDADDIWLNGFVFPQSDNLPEYIKKIDDLYEINSNDYAYYYDDDLTINSEFRYNTKLISTLFVNGDLYINNNVLPDNSDNFLTFIVNGDIIIDNDFGINDYKNEENFSKDTSANINAGLVSLNRNGGIEFRATEDFVNNPDNPLVVQGFIISIGSIDINRDLGVNNAFYPSIVIKSNNEYIANTSKTIQENIAGIEVFDIQWEYYD